MAKPRILIVEDDPDGRASVKEVMEDGGFEPVTAATGREGVERFRQEPADVVLSDLVLPDIDGVQVLTEIRRMDRQVPVLIMTAYGTIASAVNALRAGAYDYINKPLDLDELQAKVARAMETRALRTEVEQLHQTIRSRYSARSMVAQSPAMRDIVAKIEALANANATVLVHGESGTGKELVARALHVDGNRRSKPFVAVNCGALTETLLESELFGHEKGAFTGAIQKRLGAFERAHGGVLFLDEIGDASLSVQVKLLRVLEEREVVRVGGAAPIPVDVRLVSATNRDLEALVAEGRFREDLFYRLKVVDLWIPPLRERREDIRPLIDRFVAAACEEHGRSFATIEPGYYEALERCEWPGNVRQLRNVVESSVLLATKPELTAADARMDSRTPPANGGKQEFVVPEGMTLAEVEKEALLQALRREKGNRTLAADKLGISRRTIQRKIKDYDLPF